MIQCMMKICVVIFIVLIGQAFAKDNAGLDEIKLADVDANVLVIAFAGVDVKEFGDEGYINTHAGESSPTKIWSAALAAPEIFDMNTSAISATYLLFQHQSPGADGSNDKRDAKTGKIMRDKTTNKILKTYDDYQRAIEYIKVWMRNDRIENKRKELILLTFSWGTKNCVMLSEWFTHEYNKIPYSIISFEAIAKVTFSFLPPLYYSADDAGIAKNTYNFYSNGNATEKDEYFFLLHGRGMNNRTVDEDSSNPSSKYYEHYKKLFDENTYLDSAHTGMEFLSERIAKDILIENAISLQNDWLKEELYFRNISINLFCGEEQ